MTTPPPPGVTEFPGAFDPPFHRSLAIRMGRDADGRGVAWVLVDPAIHYGTTNAHGGVVPALVDIASAVAIATSTRAPTDRTTIVEGTVEMKVSYLRRVSDGYLWARADPVHIGKRIAVTDVDILNGDVLVAKGIATFMLRDQD